MRVLRVLLCDSSEIHMFRSGLSSIPGFVTCKPYRYSVRLPLVSIRHLHGHRRLLKETDRSGKYFQSESSADNKEEDEPIESSTSSRVPTTEERLQKLNNHEHRIILDKSRAVSKHHHPQDPATGSVGQNVNEATEQAPREEYKQQQDDQCDLLSDSFEDMEPYIDTHACFVELRKAGFSEAQAGTVISILLCLLNDKLQKLSTQYAQSYELENERYLFESAQEELRVDVTRSREQHIHEMISLINGLERDFSIISDELTTELINMKNGIEVAINDQKQENTLLSKMFILKIQEANHKITTELISSMRSEIESLRWNLSRWGLMAIITSLFMGCSIVYFNRVNRTNKQERHEFTPLVIYEPSELEEDDYHDDLDKSVVA